MPVAHVNGLDVYHERWGDGPPLLVPDSEAIAAAVPGAGLRVYGGGHACFVQDGRAPADILESLAD